MIDPKSLKNMLQCEGIDLRTWVSYGVILSSAPDTPVDFQFQQYFPNVSHGSIVVREDGVYAYIVLVPTRDLTIAKLAMPYAAPGGCLYFPPVEGQQVLVTIPSGDKDEMATFVPAPQDAVNTTVPSAVLEDPTAVRLKTPEGVSLKMDAAGVNLNSGENGAARKEDSITSSETEDPAFWTWVNAVSAAAGVPGPAPTTLTGKITGGSETVKIGD